MLDILMWATDGIDNGTFDDPIRCERIAKEFIIENMNKILAVIDKQFTMLDDLTKELNTHKWAAPWQRYTKYSYTKSALEQSRKYYTKFK
jgi:hypothetical protein